MELVQVNIKNVCFLLIFIELGYVERKGQAIVMSIKTNKCGDM